MIVVTNRLPVAPGKEEEFEERFRKRAHLVEGSPGFIRNEIHRPVPLARGKEPGEWVKPENFSGYYEVKTWWRSFDDFVAWTQSDSFRQAHRNVVDDKGRPSAETKAPQLLRGSPELVVHEVFSESTAENPAID